MTCESHYNRINDTFSQRAWSVLDIGTISAVDSGHLVRLDRQNNTTFYQELLFQHFLPNIAIAIYQTTIFPQDIAPCHGAVSQLFFRR